MILTEKVKFTTAQLALLNRGLNFIPTRGSNNKIRAQARFDLQKYHRTLKLWSYYESGKTGNNPEQIKPPFTPKSNWTPPDSSLPTHITELIKKDLEYFENSFETLRIPTNLTPEENSALQELRQNKQIIIKPADKGSVVVIMDLEQYLWEGNRQLNDPKYYNKLNKPIYKETYTQIIKIFQTIYDKKLINAKQRNYLIGESEPRPRRFYLLPKIHKDPAIWSKPFKIPPGRPIVSDCSSETYRAAEFIDYFINPLAKTHKSYIKDTYDFINKIKNLHIPEGSLLFTIDVDSLYTNIVTQEGIQAVKEAFFKFRDKKRPDKELLQLLEINLTRNDFEFNGNYFLQIKGTAMGKKFAPAYADIFMASWETAALERCPKKPLYYYRYLDDIWGIWSYSEDEFISFFNILNTFNPSIKLKYTTDSNSVNFLDTTTFKGPKFTSHNQLDIKVYFKDTDTHALLHKSSYHPRHTFAGLIKSQLLRFHRICTQADDFKQATKVLFSALSSRGYSRTFLRSCFKSFLQSRPLSTSTLLPFVTTFSSSTVKLVKNIKNNLEIIRNKHKIQEDIRIIAAFRKNKNLRDHLVRAKVIPQTQPQSHPAQEQNKNRRVYFMQHKWVHDVQNKTVHVTAKFCNVSTKNCVYLITCKTCGLKYVGETSLPLHVRISVHKYNIVRKKYTDRQVVQHFVLHGWEAVQVLILECNPHWSTAQRRRAERGWIFKLGTTIPTGLNERLYFRP